MTPPRGTSWEEAAPRGTSDNLASDKLPRMRIPPIDVSAPPPPPPAQAPASSGGSGPARVIVLCGGFLAPRSSAFDKHYFGNGLELPHELRDADEGWRVVVVHPSPVGSLHDRGEPPTKRTRVRASACRLPPAARRRPSPPAAAAALSRSSSARPSSNAMHARAHTTTRSRYPSPPSRFPDAACQVFRELKTGGAVEFANGQPTGAPYRNDSDMRTDAASASASASDDGPHSPMSATNTTRALHSEWDASSPIHLIGHSYGGNTIRKLLELLTVGHPALCDHDGRWARPSSAWVRSITCINTPLNGAPLVYGLGESPVAPPKVRLRARARACASSTPPSTPPPASLTPHSPSPPLSPSLSLSSSSPPALSCNSAGSVWFGWLHAQLFHCVG